MYVVFLNSSHVSITVHRQLEGPRTVSHYKNLNRLDGWLQLKQSSSELSELAAGNRLKRLDVVQSVTLPRG